MRRRFLVFMLFALALPFSWQAQACIVVGAKPEQVKGIINDALYIGKLEVRKIDKTPNLTQKDKDFYQEMGWGNPIEITLDPVQSYKGSIESNFIVHEFDSSCSKNLPNVGYIYEDVIFQRKNGQSVLSGKPSLLPNDAWEELRAKAKPSKSLEELMKKCKQKQSIWASRQEGYLNIFYCKSN